MMVPAALLCKPHDNDLRLMFGACSAPGALQLYLPALALEGRRGSGALARGPRHLEQVTDIVQLSDPEGMGEKQHKSVSKVVGPGYVLKPVSLRNSCFLRTYVSSPETGTLRLKKLQALQVLSKTKGKLRNRQLEEKRESRVLEMSVKVGNQRKGSFRKGLRKRRGQHVPET